LRFPDKPSQTKMVVPALCNLQGHRESLDNRLHGL